MKILGNFRKGMIAFCLTVFALCLSVGGYFFARTYKNLEPNAVALDVSDPNDFKYNELEDGTVEIKGFVDEPQGSINLKLPSQSPAGKDVTKIGYRAFSIDKYTDFNIQTIEFPENLKIIGDYAFSGDINDESRREVLSSHSFTVINIPASVTEIGSSAFYLCSSLKTVTFAPESNLETIGSKAFAADIYVSSLSSHGSGSKTYCIDEYSAGSNNISEITIPKSVIEIGSDAFYLCENLKTVNFEQDSMLETIGSRAFAGVYTASKVHQDCNEESVCKTYKNKITSITLPENLRRIEEDAFKYCDLTSLEIPKNCEYVDPSVLNSCDNWTLNNENTNFDGSRELNYLYNINTDTLCWCNEKNIPSDVQEKVQVIGKNVFKGATLNSEFTIPKNVVKIEASAFYSVEGLTTINYEGTSVDDWVQITFENGMANPLNNFSVQLMIGETLQDNVTITKNINDYAFYEYSKLKSVTLNSDVTTIGAYAFYDCNGLTTITMDKSVTEIGAYAFYSGLSLIDVKYGGTIDDWAQITFENGAANPLNNSSAQLMIGETLQDNITINKNINAYAFYKYSKLESVILTDAATSIGNKAFYSSSITALTLDKGVNSIGERAFYDCNGLTTITMDKSVTEIGAYSFYSNSSLTDVKYSGTIDDWVQITFANGTANPLNNSSAQLKIGDVLQEDVTISKNINAYAFYGYKKLSMVILGNQVQSIGQDVFYNSGVAFISIPSTFTECDASMLKTGYNSSYYISTIVVDTKEKYDELTAEGGNLYDCRNCVCYKIDVTFKTVEAQNIASLPYKRVNYTYSEGQWKNSAFEWSYGDNWSDGNGSYIRDLAQFTQVWQSGNIKDNITLTQQTLANEIKDEPTGVIISSQKGFFKDATTLTVTETTDAETLTSKLGDLYYDGVVKILEASQEQVESAKTTDVNYGLDAEAVKDFIVCLKYNVGSSYSPRYILTVQKPVDGKYNFGTEVPTIVLISKDGSEVEPPKVVEKTDTNETFFAHNDEGFADNVTLTVQEKTDKTEMQALLQDAYNDKVKKVYVVELNNSVSEQTKIWFYAGLAGDYVVNKLSGNELSALTAQDGKYTVDGNSVTIVLTERESTSIPPTVNENKTVDNSTNLGEIIGLAIVCGIELIAIVILMIVAYKKRKKINETNEK